MTAVDFFQLVELLDPNKAVVKMSYRTHKRILGITGCVSDPEKAWTDNEIPNKLNGVPIEHEDILLGIVELVATYTLHTKKIISIKVEV